MTRDASLDLARVLATAACVAGHAAHEFGGAPLAGRAVDVFFALSGCLCASQLASGASPAPWLRRRLRRVYPAAVVVLVLAGAPWWSWTLISFSLQGGGTLHAWSLSVEVVGYAGLAVLALAPRALWVPALALVVAVCAVGRALVDGWTAYHVLRWDGMAVGALWALAGAPAIPWLALLLPASLAIPGWAAPLPAALGSVGLLSWMRGTKHGSPWLTSRSYCVYLVHYPLLSAGLGPLAILLTPLAAEALYRLVDEPLALRR